MMKPRDMMFDFTSEIKAGGSAKAVWIAPGTIEVGGSAVGLEPRTIWPNRSTTWPVPLGGEGADNRPVERAAWKAASAGPCTPEVC